MTDGKIIRENTDPDTKKPIRTSHDEYKQADDETQDMDGRNQKWRYQHSRSTRKEDYKNRQTDSLAQKLEEMMTQTATAESHPREEQAERRKIAEQQ